MALAQGELTIVQTANGARIDMGGGGGHSVSGPDAVKALMDAYGSRIGKVVDSSGNTTVVNEYKEPPKKDVDPAMLQEVPTMHVEFQRNEDGSIAKDANGKNIVESFGVKYADGTISYTGAGREGVLEAERRRSQAKLHNDFITDARTRDDFASDNEYQNFLTVKNIRIGQGSYVKLQDKQGNSKLVAPNGAVVAEGTEEEIRNAYRTKSNQLNLALASAERVQSFTTNEKRYVMEKQGLANDAEFNAYVRSQMQQSRQALDNIYNSWGIAAQEQGISTEGKMWYTPNLPDLETFVPNVTDSVIGYDEWYSTNIQGIKAEIGDEADQIDDTGGVEEGTVDQTITAPEAPAVDVPEPPVVPDVPSTTTGGFYQPFVQTPTSSVTQIPGYQTVEGVYPTSGTATTGTTTTPAATTTSAVPETINYFTDYTGTTDANLTSASQGGLGAMKRYRNKYTGQIMLVQLDPEGNPMTYVPAAFEPVNDDAVTTTTGQQQQASTSGIANSPGSTNAAQFGKLAAGMLFADGGSVESKQNEALYTIAKMNGYNGPKSGTALKAFFNSSDALKAKARAIGVAMAKGGVVPENTMIAGQPHSLAYINPQEEKLLKAAGGSGAPSYGGIPAYFTLGPGTTVGETTTDPSTGTKYTWDGTNWNVDNTASENMQPGATIDNSFATQLAGQTKSLIGETMAPTQAGVSYIQPEAADFIGDTAGQAYYQAPMQEAETVADITQTGVPQVAPTSVMTPATVSDQVQTTTEGLTGVTGTLGTQAQVDAAQQTGTSVAGLEAAQGTATKVNAPDARDIQKGEIISGVADATKAAKFTEQIQAAEATPSKQATVQGQLEGLMQQFEGGNTPAWAAGSMRTAMQTLAARGLGASSLAGQAVIQATMEAALPIAQMDAQTQAQFEAQNLSNRQQRAMLAAQQRAQFLGQEFDQAFQARVQNSARIGDIANMNFTAEQNIALENSRAANTMNLNNLSNSQAMVMAEAAALANLDMANLNNRQQAAVQNAQNFLQMDMANLSNLQQTAMFKAQQNIQALFTDQAAENAASQFNATSENQSNQFFANLTTQVGQFNAAQQNAMNQFNVNSVNAMREFNGELQQQRDLFNAQNGLVVAQANAQWRQNIATMNTAAQNESNMNFAKTMNAFTSTNLDAYWQRERDVMSFAFTSAENAADRLASVLLENLSAENKASLADEMGKGSLGATLLKGALNYMAGGVIV
jgi:hypothetical protein